MGKILDDILYDFHNCRLRVLEKSRFRFAAYYIVVEPRLGIWFLGVIYTDFEK